MNYAVVGAIALIAGCLIGWSITRSGKNRQLSGLRKQMADDMLHKISMPWYEVDGKIVAVLHLTALRNVVLEGGGLVKSFEIQMDCDISLDGKSINKEGFVVANVGDFTKKR